MTSVSSRTQARLAALAALLLCLLVAGGAPAARAQAPAATPLQGTVKNATAGGSVPAGLTVTAHELDSGATTEVASSTVVVGPGGAWSIGNLPAKPGDRFAITADYLGVTYVAEAHPPTSTVLSIYETTTDPTVLSVPSETLTVLTTKGDTFNVIQVLAVRNSSDRTYIGAPDPAGSGLRQTVELPAPTGFSQFAPGPGITGQLSTGADGMPMSSDPVNPGTTSVTYFYDVTVARSGWPLSRPVIYPTGREEILLDSGLSLTGPGLHKLKTVTIQKKPYTDYQGGALAPGTALSASITYASSNSLTLWISLAFLLVLAIGSALGFPRLFRWAKATRPAQPGLEAPSRDDLVEEIAALDEAHEAGEVEDDTYTSRRKLLKTKLRALTAAGIGEGNLDAEVDEGAGET
ncbi:MAG TPA: hypothetical protein VFW71_01540 [Actinomycetota bacterium]|nr:hypothetical protein [Actinomycetota bacterium]